MTNFQKYLNKIFLTIFLPLFFLFNCTVFPDNALKGSVYDIGSNLDYKQVSKRSSVVLGVEFPLVRSPLLTPYLVIRDRHDRLTNYFLRLSDSLPMHLQARMIEALRKANLAGLIVRTTDGIIPSMTLKSEVINFEIRKEVNENQTLKEQQVAKMQETKYYFVFEINFILIENRKNPRILSRSFGKKYALDSLTDVEIVYKIRNSLHSVFEEMILWLNTSLSKKSLLG